MNKEEHLHKAVVDWLKYQYKDIIFNSDMSGVVLPKQVAVKISRLRSSRAMPDIVIYESRHEYHAMFIELKHQDTRLILKDGSLTREKHIREQANLLVDLSERGYLAEFAQGFDEATEIIEWYLEEKTCKYPGKDYCREIRRERRDIRRERFEKKLKKRQEHERLGKSRKDRRNE